MTSIQSPHTAGRAESPRASVSIWNMPEEDRRIAIARRAANGARKALGRRDVIVIAPTPPPQYPAPQIVVPMSGRKWKRILAEVAIEHGIPPVLILGKQRQRQIMAARHHAIYRMSQETDMSLAEIGRHMGRDHSTVISGIRAHQRRQAASAQSPLSTVFTGSGQKPLTQHLVGRDASS
jgi:hypothetical protein